MYTLMLKYPILAQIDDRTAEQISRKVWIETLAAFSKQNVDAAFVLVKHGITFTCPARSILYKLHRPKGTV